MKQSDQASDRQSLPTRVLQIVGRMDRAGAENFLMNVYRHLDRTKVQFDFVYFTEEPCDFDEEIRALGGRIFRIRGPSMLSRCAGLWALARRGRWKIAHAHTLFSSGLYLFVCRLAGVKRLIIHSHTTQDTHRTSLGRLFYQKAMRFLISKLATDYLACGKAASTFLYGQRKDVAVIPNAVDVERYIEAGELNSSSNNGSGKLSILQVGRFADVKNHEHSLLVANELKLAEIDFELLFAGVGEGEQRIRSRTDQLKLGSDVKFLGLRSDIPKLMAEADVLLMPSIFEGFPVTLVESQAAGLPAVISSSISSQVDLDLGLIHFVDLQAPTSDWKDRILSASRNVSPGPLERLAELEKRGFSAYHAAKRMARMYS